MRETGGGAMSELRLAAMIERAADAVADNDWRGALRGLLEGWRASRAPELARAYELLARHTDAEPLMGVDPSVRLRSFRARADRVAKDRRDLPLLLDEPWHPDLPERERLELLRPWGPDPLLAGALARRLRLPAAPEPLDGELLELILELLEHQGDRRQLSALTHFEAHATLRSHQRRRVAAVCAALEAIVESPLDPLAARALARFDARQRGAEREQHERAALFERIFQDPSDAGARAVLADYLTSRGDPRGEFIMLQLERGVGRQAPTARERALLTRHAHEWAGPLHAALGLDGRRFEGGFLTAASIELAPLPSALIEIPDWSTLTALDGHVPKRLVESGRIDRLETLYGFLDLGAFMAARAAGRLPWIRHYEARIDRGLPEGPLGLRSIVLRHATNANLRALIDSGALEGVEEIVLHYHPDPDRGPEWTADHRENLRPADRVATMNELLPAHVERLRLIDARSARASRPEGWMLTFSRSEAGQFARLRIDHGLRGGVDIGSIAAVLESFAPGRIERPITIAEPAQPER